MNGTWIGSIEFYIDLLAMFVLTVGSYCWAMADVTRGRLPWATGKWWDWWHWYNRCATSYISGALASLYLYHKYGHVMSSACSTVGVILWYYGRGKNQHDHWDAVLPVRAFRKVMSWLKP